MQAAKTFDWAIRILNLVGAIAWVLVAFSVLSTIESGTYLNGITYAPIENGTIVVHNYDSVVIADGEMFFALNDSASESGKIDSSRDLLKCMYAEDE